jgi:hypothetical protein
MTLAIEPIESFQELEDGPGELTATDNGKLPMWSWQDQRFIMIPLPGRRDAAVGFSGITLQTVLNYFANLPMTDPGVAGVLWNENGFVRISTGAVASVSGTPIGLLLTLTYP